MSGENTKIKVYCETTVIGDMTSRPQTLPKIIAVCEQNGFKCPLIGTPEQLKEVYHGNN